MERVRVHLEINALILDLDGVLWRGEQPIGDLPEIFAEIDKAALQVVFATNNSTLTVQDYLGKLSRLGVPAQPWQVITSAEATAAYLEQNQPAVRRVYVVGERGLEETLSAHGFEIDSITAEAVVAGLDREFSYQKMSTAMGLILAGAELIGTNPDMTLPQPQGSIPGAGAIIASLEAATGKKAKIIGKPQQELFRQALGRLGADPEHVLVVGDRLETDVAGGQASGCLTAAVLSGASTQSQAERWKPRPDFIAADLSDLIKQIRQKTP